MTVLTFIISFFTGIKFRNLPNRNFHIEMCQGMDNNGIALDLLFILERITWYYLNLKS